MNSNRVRIKRIFLKILFIAMILIAAPSALKAAPVEDEPKGQNLPFKVSCTAYSNECGNLTANGKKTIEGRTMAGKEEWLGAWAVLYEVSENGGIGNFIGFREISDTGYGVPSKLFPGKGTIETGETVDLYFESTADALLWGQKEIYIQIMKEEK